VHQEQSNHFNSYILIYMVQSIQLHFARVNISYSFIDDFSRKTWIYFLKQKLKAFVAFKNFEALAEKVTLKSKFGGVIEDKEFTSWEFNIYVKFIRFAIHWLFLNHYSKIE